MGRLLSDEYVVWNRYVRYDVVFTERGAERHQSVSEEDTKNGVTAESGFVI